MKTVKIKILGWVRLYLPGKLSDVIYSWLMPNSKAAIVKRHIRLAELDSPRMAYRAAWCLATRVFIFGIFSDFHPLDSLTIWCRLKKLLEKLIMFWLLGNQQSGWFSHKSLLSERETLQLLSVQCLWTKWRWWSLATLISLEFKCVVAVSETVQPYIQKRKGNTLP
jgi:hypothetical protein